MNQFSHLQNYLGSSYYSCIDRLFFTLGYAEIQRVETKDNGLQFRLGGDGGSDHYHVVVMDTTTERSDEPIEIDQDLINEAYGIDPFLSTVLESFSKAGWLLDNTPVDLYDGTIELRLWINTPFTNDLRACITRTYFEEDEPMNPIHEAGEIPYSPYNNLHKVSVESDSFNAHYKSDNSQIVDVKVIKNKSPHLKGYPIKTIPLQMLVDSWNYGSTQMTIADMVQRLRTSDPDTQDLILNDLSILASMNVVFITGILAFKKTLENRIAELNIDQPFHKNLIIRATTMMNVLAKMRGASAVPSQPCFSVEGFDVQFSVGDSQIGITIKQDGYEDLTCTSLRKT